MLHGLINDLITGCSPPKKCVESRGNEPGVGEDGGGGQGDFVKVVVPHKVLGVVAQSSLEIRSQVARHGDGDDQGGADPEGAPQVGLAAGDVFSGLDHYLCRGDWTFELCAAVPPSPTQLDDAHRASRFAGHDPRPRVIRDVYRRHRGTS